jgi:Zn-dependent membrane protease YugP
MFFDPLYFLIVGPAFIFALVAQGMVKRAYAKYAKVRSRSGVSGADVAQAILEREGVHDVRIEPHQGFLSDHYDPSSRALRLSPGVYSGRSLAAAGIAAHEVGHAIQHARSYVPLQIRSALVPVTKLGSGLAMPLFLIGFIFQSLALIKVGVILFGAVVLFQLVTLPVEFNASRRALAILEQGGILAPDELSGARTVLRAAAMTYVAAAAAAVSQLIYFLLRAGLLGGRR